MEDNGNREKRTPSGNMLSGSIFPGPCRYGLCFRGGYIECCPVRYDCCRTAIRQTKNQEVSQGLKSLVRLRFFRKSPLFRNLTFA